MLKAMIYVLIGCWDMGIERGRPLIRDGISNRRQIKLTPESSTQCFRPLIGVIISNRCHASS